MKRRFIMTGTIAFFVLMLFFPKPVFKGASNGLLLWFQIVLPTLLPFIIVSNLLIHTHSIDWIARVTGPVLCRFFRVSSYGSFAIVAGFLCGYPMGSKITADLIRGNYISTSEGRYLLSFCNNTSPMFIISYVIWQNLKDPGLTVPSVAILFASPIIMSFLFRKLLKIHSAPGYGNTSSSMPLNGKASGSLIDSCIMNGFETITKVGGYIMLFSVFISLAQLVPLHHPVFTMLALPSLEITNGITMLTQIAPGTSAAFILSLALTSFGGWCSIAQTRCMIQGTGLSIVPYTIEKLATAAVTSLLAYIYILL